ncbi:MAG: ATP-binding protein, partial [Thiotrichaceae bacterium]
AFTPDRQEILKILAGQAAISLENAMLYTERKRAEEARERLNAQLRAKNTELEQIVYVTSHDLRSPLVNVQGFSKELEIAFREVASAIESEGVPSEVKERLTPLLEEDIPEAVRFILTSISKMDALLSGLLRLSRLGRVALTIEELDMNSLMSDIAAASEFQIKEQGVTLDIGELPPCKGDKAQITQVFSNLLDNALKYLDPGRSGIIHIAGRKKQEKVIYCVEDNGIGIAQTHQEKIFEIFQRFDPNIASGEGLGLTIVRRILDRCHGKIWVESEPGKGSRFFVALPAVR